MTLWNEKTRVTVGSISIELPALLVRDRSHPIDTSAGVFEAERLTVIVDEGPFADRLDRIGGTEHEERTGEVAGCTGRLVSFLSPPDNTRTMGFHAMAPRGFTVLVRADLSVPHDVVEDVFHSLQLITTTLGDESDVEPKS